LAVSNNERLKSLPDVPTVIEAGYAEAVVLPWAGLFAPAGTPPAVLDKVAAELKKALRDPDVQQRYDGLSASNPGFYREAFDRFVGEEALRWQRVVVARKLKPE
jgi:tripartite-type tricarboxylate transporter receptor subunit TctC